MKAPHLKRVCLLLLISTLWLACKKDNNGTVEPTQRSIKYELSGTFSGKLLVVTSTNSGQLQQFNNVALPWSKELTYDAAVLAAGAALQTENEHRGVAGQSLVLKVYLNNQLKDTRSITADGNGIINMALSFYTF